LLSGVDHVQPLLKRRARDGSARARALPPRHPAPALPSFVGGLKQDGRSPGAASAGRHRHPRPQLDRLKQVARLRGRRAAGRHHRGDSSSGSSSTALRHAHRAIRRRWGLREPGKTQNGFVVWFPACPALAVDHRQRARHGLGKRGRRRAS
jgi:hypothetical protein